MTNKFKSKFIKILNEQDDTDIDLDPEIDAGLDLDPDAEAGAAEDYLDDGVGMDDFATDTEVDPSDVDEVSDAIQRQNEQMKGVIDSWSGRIDEFLNFLNGDSSESLQSVLANASDQTAVGDLKNQQHKIGRIASELAALQQSFLTAKKSS